MQKIKLLVVGSDRNLFKKDSDIRNRYLDYGKLFEEIHVIVFSHKNLGNRNLKIGGNVFIYPTNHICKLFYLWNIYKISKQIIKSSLSAPTLVKSEVGVPTTERVGIVSAQDAFESGLAGWMLKKMYKIPLQIQIHTDFLSPYFWKESFTNKLRVVLAKFLIPRADSIRVVSQRIKNSIIVNCKLKIENSAIAVLPIFVDTQLIKSTPIKIDLHKKYPQFDFIVLMASRLTKEKNIGLAIEAMADLVRKSASWRIKLGLVIVGAGPGLKGLKILNCKLKIKDNVIFENWSDDLSSYYKTADLFLLTSNYEGYGRSVIEAMSVGLPVVMTGVGLAGETLINDENGVVVPVGDSKTLVDSIGSLIANKSKRDVFSASALKTIEKLLKKEQYLKLYKESFN